MRKVTVLATHDCDARRICAPCECRDLPSSRPLRGGFVRWPLALVRMLSRVRVREGRSVLKVSQAEWAHLWADYAFVEQVRAPGPFEPGHGVFDTLWIVIRGRLDPVSSV